MATMKFAFIPLTLFILLEAINARHLHDASIKEIFNQRPPSHETVVQMVTREKELRLPKSSSLSSPHDRTTYDRVNPSPPPPIVAPSTGHATYGRANSSPPRGPNKHGRVEPRTPPSPNPNDSQGHGMYGRVDPSAPAPSKPADPARPLVSDGETFSDVKMVSHEDQWLNMLAL